MCCFEFVSFTAELATNVCVGCNNSVIHPCWCTGGIIIITTHPYRPYAIPRITEDIYYIDIDNLGR